MAEAIRDERNRVPRPHYVAAVLNDEDDDLPSAVLGIGSGESDDSDFAFE